MRGHIITLWLTRQPKKGKDIQMLLLFVVLHTLLTVVGSASAFIAPVASKCLLTARRSTDGGTTTYSRMPPLLMATKNELLVQKLQQEINQIEQQRIAAEQYIQSYEPEIEKAKKYLDDCDASVADKTRRLVKAENDVAAGISGEIDLLGLAPAIVAPLGALAAIRAVIQKRQEVQAEKIRLVEETRRRLEEEEARLARLAEEKMRKGKIRNAATIAAGVAGIALAVNLFASGETSTTQVPIMRPEQQVVIAEPPKNKPTAPEKQTVKDNEHPSTETIEAEMPITIKEDMKLPTEQETTAAQRMDPEIPASKLDVPNIKPPSVDAPKLELPKFGAPAGLNLPDIVPPKLELPKLSAPKINLPSLPNLDVGKLKLSAPQIDLPSLPNLDVGELKLSAPKIELPSLPNLDVGEFNLPEDVDPITLGIAGTVGVAVVGIGAAFAGKGSPEPKDASKVKGTAKPAKVEMAVTPEAPKSGSMETEPEPPQAKIEFESTSETEPELNPEAASAPVEPKPATQPADIEAPATESSKPESEPPQTIADAAIADAETVEVEPEATPEADSEPVELTEPKDDSAPEAEPVSSASSSEPETPDARTETPPEPEVPPSEEELPPTAPEGTTETVTEPEVPPSENQPAESEPESPQADAEPDEVKAKDESADLQPETSPLKGVSPEPEPREEPGAQEIKAPPDPETPEVKMERKPHVETEPQETENEKPSDRDPPQTTDDELNLPSRKRDPPKGFGKPKGKRKRS